MAEFSIEIPFDIERAGEAVENFYVSMILKGESPRMAEMLALRQPPAAMTDDVFLGGQGSLDSQIPNPRQLDQITRTAMRHGYKPKPTDVYSPQLARFPGDPQAFLNHGQARGHVRRVCEQRGVDCLDSHGNTMVKARREPEKDPYEHPRHKLHPKIVQRKISEKVRENPDLKRKDKRELAEMVMDQHGPRK